MASTSGDKTLKPILRPYDTIGSTRYVDFDTTRPTYETDPDRCHISHVVASSWGFWHMGQFGWDYKARFGELPWVTLQIKKT